MAYNDREKSTHSAAPVELYLFEQGLLTWAYTSSDRQQNFQNRVYLPEAISRTAIDQSQEEHAGSITVSLPRDNDVARMFLSYLPVSPVKLRVYRFHRGANDYVQAFAGTITSGQFTESEAKLPVMPASQALRRMIPIAVYQPQCNHPLYSQTKTYGIEGTKQQAESIGCGVDKEKYRVVATVSAVDGLSVISPQFADHDDGHFTFGFLQLPTGEVRWITEHVGNTVKLTSPLSLATGDAVSAFPGCDGLESTCSGKFDNIDNHNGFSRIPTKNPFNSSLV